MDEIGMTGGGYEYEFIYTPTHPGNFTAYVKSGGINCDINNNSIWMAPIWRSAIATTLNFNWNGRPIIEGTSEQISMNWSFTLNFPSPGIYTFYLSGDYTAELFLSGKSQIPTGDNTVYPRDQMSQINISEESIEVYLLHNNLDSFANLILEWESDAFSSQIIHPKYIGNPNPEITQVINQ